MKLNIVHNWIFTMSQIQNSIGGPLKFGPIENNIEKLPRETF